MVIRFRFSKTIYNNDETRTRLRSPRARKMLKMNTKLYMHALQIIFPFYFRIFISLPRFFIIKTVLCSIWNVENSATFQNKNHLQTNSYINHAKKSYKIWNENWKKEWKYYALLIWEPIFPPIQFRISGFFIALWYLFHLIKEILSISQTNASWYVTKFF